MHHQLCKSNCQTQDENEIIVLHTIDQMIQNGNNKGLINKIAAVTSQAQKGEVTEFQSLLKGLTV
jgi:hypothetical protein